jgi:hypothetical protein
MGIWGDFKHHALGMDRTPEQVAEDNRKKRMNALMDKQLSALEGDSAGLENRQVIDPAVMEQMRAAALGQAQSAAEIQMRSGLQQQQAQAYGLAASGAGGTNPALALRTAQQAAGQAGLQTTAQMAAMRADETGKALGMYAQAAMGQQGMNDQQKAQYEGMINQIVQTQYNGDLQMALQDQGFLDKLMMSFGGGLMTGVGQGVAAWLLPSGSSGGTGGKFT